MRARTVLVKARVWESWQTTDQKERRTVELLTMSRRSNLTCFSNNIDAPRH